ncbi:MAG TPA: LptF/LptG family permease [Azospirillaceae bacterium]|nr:LptF/LptG family permease [Azospirillaceae bacterium]
MSLYVLRQLAVATVFVTLALAAALLLAQSMRLIDLVIDGGAPFWMFLWLMLLTLPTFLGIILPIGLVGAVLFTYNRLLADSELVVMRAAGLGPWALARPALVMAGGVTLMVFTLNLHITPAAHRELVKLEYLVRSEYSSVLLREGAFNDIDNNVTVYLRERTAEGDLKGLLIHDTRMKDRPVTIMADRGLMAMGPVGPRVLLFNGIRDEVGEEPGQVSHLFFDRYTIDIKVLKSDIATRWSEPRERPIGHLLNAGDDPKDRLLLPRFMAELHMRLSTPFFGFSFALIGLAALLSGEFNRRGQARRITMAVLMVVVLEGGGLGLANAASKNEALVPVLYFVVSAPAVAGAWVLRRRPRSVPPSRPAAPLSAS